MNRENAEKIAVPLYKERLLKRAKRLIKYLERKVEKAVHKGKDGIKVRANRFNPWAVRRLLRNEECSEIARKYFEDLGFDIEGLYTKGNAWSSLHINGIFIDWRPYNLTESCVICTIDSRLKHLIKNGTPPKVLDEDLSV